MKVIIDDKIPYIKGALEPFCNVIYLPGGKITAGHVKEADALITRTRTICNEELLAGSAVKFIASATIGFDHIDTEFCDKAGISWTNAPGCNAGSAISPRPASGPLFIQRRSFPIFIRLTATVFN